MNWINTNKRYVIDLAERVGKTFLQAFAGVWLIPVAADVLNGNASTLGTIWGSLADTSILDKAAVGGISAVIALVMGVWAKRVGSPNTAALLPSSEDTPRA